MPRREPERALIQQKRDRSPPNLVEIFVEVIPVQDFPPVVGSRNRSNQIPNPVMTIAQARQGGVLNGC